MKNIIVAAFALIVLLAPQTLFAQQSNSPAVPVPAEAAAKSSQNAPLTARQTEELQARLHMARKEYSEAAKAYSQLSVEDPRNASYANFVGLALMQEGDFDGARKAFDHATKINKRFSDAYNNLGAIYYGQKQYKKAISEYEKAISIDHNIPGLYVNLGYAFFAEKEFPKATEALHKALALDPDIFTQNDRNGTLLTFRSVTDRGLFDFTLAKGFAQNGEGVNCALYLRKAIDDGYKDVLKIRTDPAFAKVLTDPDVKSLLDQLEPQETKSSPAPPSS